MADGVFMVGRPGVVTTSLCNYPPTFWSDVLPQGAIGHKLVHQNLLFLLVTVTQEAHQVAVRHLGDDIHLQRTQKERKLFGRVFDPP